MLEGVSKLAKMLASDELKTRKLGHKYVRDLFSLKPGSDICELSYEDILGVCKGLHYSLWMQDKLLLQEEIVKRIVHLVPTIKSRQIRCMYINAMFETLAREWDNLDVWRLDKFMMLTRDLFVRCLTSTKKRSIPIKTLTDAVFDKVLNNNLNSAIELKLHLVTVIQQELVKVKDIPMVVQSFFKRTLKVIEDVPRLMRTYPKLPLKEISEELLAASTKYTAHRKILCRVAQM
ncbi:unnamed protein product [Mesocestoides corti]|uniref:Uncharacterized protein n=1 Tax=Mesocestoides corti TaxID=53468 RepID=A0A0R3UDY0_MESCO|nr:unnamed protein product [Mesocestoides corti]